MRGEVRVEVHGGGRGMPSGDAGNRQVNWQKTSNQFVLSFTGRSDDVQDGAVSLLNAVVQSNWQRPLQPPVAEEDIPIQDIKA